MKTPLSQIQKKIYREQTKYSESTFFNNPVLCTLPQDCDLMKLKSAVDDVIFAHSGLDIRFGEDAEGEVYTDSDAGVLVEIIPLGDESIEEKKRELVRPFDLKKKAARFEIYQGAEHSYLFIDIHSVIYDKESHRVLAEDLKRAYDGEMPEVELRTAFDVALGENKELSSEAAGVCEKFFEELFAKYDNCQMVSEEADEVSAEWKSSENEFLINGLKLDELTEQKVCTKESFFAAVLGYVMAKSQNKAVSFLNVYNGLRAEKDHNTLANMLQVNPLLTEIDDEQNVNEFLKKSSETLNKCRDNTGYPFLRFMEDKGIREEVKFIFYSEMPECFVLKNYEESAQVLAGDNQLSDCKLAFEVICKSGNLLSIKTGYRTDYISDEIAGKLAKAFVDVSTEFLENKNITEIDVSDLPQLKLKMIQNEEEEQDKSASNTEPEIKAEEKPEKEPEIKEEEKAETKEEEEPEEKPETKEEEEPEKEPEIKEEEKSEKESEIKEEEKPEKEPEIKEEEKSEKEPEIKEEEKSEKEPEIESEEKSEKEPEIKEEEKSEKEPEIKSEEKAEEEPETKEEETTVKVEEEPESEKKAQVYDKKEFYSVTDMQREIAEYCDENPNSTAYNNPVLFRLAYNVDPEKLGRSVAAAINAHPYMKLRLVKNEEGDYQVFRDDEARAICEINDCERFPDTSTLLKAFKLYEENLYRAMIYVTESFKYFYFDAHSLICDTESLRLFYKDIERAYAGEELSGEEFTAFEKTLASEEVKEAGSDAAEKYYADILKNAVMTELFDKDDEGEETAARYTCIISAAADKIAAYCHENNTSMYALFNTVMAYVLGKYTYTSEVTFASVCNGRDDVRVKNAVAMLEKKIPVCVDISEKENVAELIIEVEKQLKSSRANSAYTFEQAKKEYGINSDIVLEYKGDVLSECEIGGEKAFKQDIKTELSLQNFTITVDVSKEKYRITADYNSGRYSDDYVHAFVESMEMAVISFIENIKIKDVSIVSDKSALIAAQNNATDIAVMANCVSRLFEEQVKKNDALTAIICGEQKFTYGQLNALANRVAHSLIAKGIEKDSVIAVSSFRSIEMYVAWLGILKAGCVILPINEKSDTEHLKKLIDTSKAALLVTKDEKTSSYIKTATVSKLVAGVNDESDLNLSIMSSALAYMTYSSYAEGLCGADYKSIMNYLSVEGNAEVKQLMEKGTVILSVADSDNSAAIMDMIVALCKGKTLCVADDKAMERADIFARLILENDIKSINLTAVFLQRILNIAQLKTALKNIDLFIVEASYLPLDLYEQVKALREDNVFVHRFSTVETVGTVSSHIVENADDIALGKAVSNTKLYVVGLDMKQLPLGAEGELLISGDCLIKDYINNQTASEKNFVEFKSARTLRTGIMAKLDNKGNVCIRERIYGYSVSSSMTDMQWEESEAEKLALKKEQPVKTLDLLSNEVTSMLESRNVGGTLGQTSLEDALAAVKLDKNADEEIKAENENEVFFEETEEIISEEKIIEESETENTVFEETAAEEIVFEEKITEVSETENTVFEETAAEEIVSEEKITEASETENTVFEETAAEENIEELNPEFMRRAIELAGRGAGYTSPNPMVGAVIVKDGRIIGEGYHERCGENHAERNAIAALSESAQGATLYVTLEPCAHQGKTPPCTEAIIENKIARVVIGSADPNPLVAGKGVTQLRDNGIEVVEGYLREECDELNPVFFHYITTGYPYVVMKYAMTADGKIATNSGDSKWVSNEQSREHVHSLRGRYSAILAGIGTVWADNPMLNCRIEDAHQPLRVIVDSHLRIPTDSQLVRTAKDYPTVVAHIDSDMPGIAEKKKALEECGVKVIALSETEGHVDIEQLFKWMGENGYDSVLVEGGGEINEAVMKCGRINRLMVYIAPKLIGGNNAKSPIGGTGISKMDDALEFSLENVQYFGDDILLEYSCSKEKKL